MINNEVYFHIQNEGIFKLHKENIVPFLKDDFFKNNLIRFLLPLGKDSLLIGSADNGLFLYDGMKIFPVFESLSEYFTLNTINRGIILENQTIIIGTILDGIIVLSRDGRPL